MDVITRLYLTDRLRR